MKALGDAVAWVGMCAFLGWVLGMAATDYAGYAPQEAPLTSTDRP